MNQFKWKIIAILLCSILYVGLMWVFPLITLQFPNYYKPEGYPINEIIIIIGITHMVILCVIGFSIILKIALEKAGIL